MNLLVIRIRKNNVPIKWFSEIEDRKNNLLCQYIYIIYYIIIIFFIYLYLFYNKWLSLYLENCYKVSFKDIF